MEIIINYSFGRYTDNIMDDASSMEHKKLRLKLLQKFISECFPGRKDYEVKSVPEEVIIDWTPFEAEFTDEEMACLRAFSRMAFFLPVSHTNNYLQVTNGILLIRCTKQKKIF